MQQEHYHFRISEFPKLVDHFYNNDLLTSSNWLDALHQYGYTSARRHDGIDKYSMPVGDYTLFALKWS